ncbi:MAG: type IV pilus biogenesis protein PilM [Planctomycetota bacterium]
MMNFLSDVKFGDIYKKGFGLFGSSRDKSAWGLEIGDKELKAVKVRFHNGELFVEAIDRFGYSATNQGVTFEKPELAEEVISDFKKRNLIEESDKIIASISGRMALLRFVSLPPMKKSRIAGAIKFELRKQIPFEPGEIIWDSHLFSGEKTSGKGTEVGIFAIKKENIHSLLPSLAPIKMNLRAIQTIPVAIYNLIQMNPDSKDDIVVVSVGDGSTDFIVIGQSKFWNRSISLSEINIDFVREIQRSMGYYLSRTKEARPENIFLMGEVFKDNEKIRFIDENFGGKVTFLDLLDKIRISEGTDQSTLNKDTLHGFEAALGLAVQGLDLGKININLLPPDYIRERHVPKQKALAGVITILIFLILLAQSVKDGTAWITLSKYANTANSTLNEVKRMERVYRNTGKKVKEEEKKLQALKSIGAQGVFGMETIRKIIDIMPEKVYLLSMESRRGAFSSSGENKKRKKLSRKKKKSVPEKVDESKRELVMSIKGESYDPRISYIEEMIKKPLEDLKLFGQQVPAFRNVELVQGSVHHVDSLKKKSESDDLDVDQNIRPIAFEIRWVVNATN